MKPQGSKLPTPGIFSYILGYFLHIFFVPLHIEAVIFSEQILMIESMNFVF